MADKIFSDKRLVSIYDAFDGERHDLNHYVGIVRELSALSILDIGCGTGCLAILLAENNFEVTAIDPAQASIEAAMRKPNADKVNWLVGDATQLSDQKFDLAVMTGNVAQVFISDSEWDLTLSSIHQYLVPDGYFVFEARDPAQRAWLGWTRNNTYRRLEIESVGSVAGWCDLIDVTGDLVSFRWSYLFESDGVTSTSDSTLRFRSREQLRQSLLKAGFKIDDIRDAPDRPGKEFVFIARASS